MNEKWNIYRESTGAWEATTDEAGPFASHAMAWEEACRLNRQEEEERMRPARERHERFQARFTEIVGEKEAARCLKGARA